MLHYEFSEVSSRDEDWGNGVTRTIGLWGPSQPCPPAVLPSDTVDSKFLAGARGDARTEVQLDRILSRQRVGIGSSPARVALQVVVQAAIHRGAAAGVISPVQGAPHLAIDVVDHMSLHGKQRILVARVVAEICIVVGKESDA